jgi:hypothetical protein
LSHTSYCFCRFAIPFKSFATLGTVHKTPDFVALGFQESDEDEYKDDHEKKTLDTMHYSFNTLQFAMHYSVE